METINIITGLDVGTTKIGCLIAEVSSSGEINIKGVGTAPSEGLRYGMVVDIEKTVRSIRKAVEAAEAMAGVAVDLVYAGIAGDHIRDINGRGVVAISGENHEVSADDVRRVIEAARAVALPMDREMIHILPQEFIVDQQRGIRDPVGMCGVRLEAEVHIVTGAVASAQNIYRCIEKAGYTTADLVLESLASSYSVLTDDAKEMGVILIDIGGGTSDIAMFYEGCLRLSRVVALGGRNVTNDIAIELRTPIEAAEKLKLAHGSAIHVDGDKEQLVEVPGMNDRSIRRVSRGLLIDIIQARMSEILTHTYEEIKNSDYLNLMTTGLVLTGGASLLPGTVEMAENIFNMPVKLGIPRGFTGMVAEAQRPQYATGVGLIMYAMQNKDDFEEGFSDNETGVFDNIVSRFKTFFKKATQLD
ncbi:cell division protein FtsA [bacterium]|nr:cell division protein FtsA [bacterium]